MRDLTAEEKKQIQTSKVLDALLEKYLAKFPKEEVEVRTAIRIVGEERAVVVLRASIATGKKVFVDYGPDPKTIDGGRVVLKG